MTPTNKLTAVGIRQAKPGHTVRKLADGGGLFLPVEPSGSKLWRLAYRFAGKQKTISMGAFPVVGLAEARAARDAAKALLLQGIDPSAARQAAKAEAAQTAPSPHGMKSRGNILACAGKPPTPTRTPRMTRVRLHSRSRRKYRSQWRLIAVCPRCSSVMLVGAKVRSIVAGG
ncbi:MAG: DUF4102 domain-containing protein [Limimaricola sp.]|uniref:Arm DNA-binding domain-containing protein n=1 Tax=Limimaricola sp. TaxID=2211665 RepID=UPI001D38FE03|nr:Arm DNA-binding domain-containing protein [Limimaricola sp.]MBI1416904.1 DUF4102 domain-containing protein [Limimaricola sp.]